MVDTGNKATEIITAHNSGLAKVAVHCSAETFVVNQRLVLRINICGKIQTLDDIKGLAHWPNYLISIIVPFLVIFFPVVRVACS